MHSTLSRYAMTYFQVEGDSKHVRAGGHVNPFSRHWQRVKLEHEADQSITFMCYQALPPVDQYPFPVSLWVQYSMSCFR